jgi:class 3 adenylate cyclase
MSTGMSDWTETPSSAADRYVLLADISGYTAFMNGVEEAHGVDFSDGVPAGFAVVGALLDAVMEGVQPRFDIAKLEGDAVFAVAPVSSLDGQGAELLTQLQTVYQAFLARRADRARRAMDHVCTACPVVASLDLKMILHRASVVRQTVGSHTELLGPAVNVAHRLLKNNVLERVGLRAYVFLTDAAAIALGVPDEGVRYAESYPDVGTIQGQVVALDDRQI